MTEETDNTPVQDTPFLPESTNPVEPPAESTPLESAKAAEPAMSTSPALAVETPPVETKAASAPSDSPSSPKPPQPTTSIPAKLAPPPPVAPAQAPPPKPKSKARRARPRRRGAGDSDSDDAAPSDNSLTDASGSDSDSNDDDDVVEAPSTKPAVNPAEKGTEKGKQPAFPDNLSTTPAAWADEKLDGEEITFNDFTAGEAKSKPKSDGEKRVYTEEQTRRFEERKVRMKEKQKARRAELKEAKKKEREVKEEPKVDELVASTSALALDDPNSNRGVELLPGGNKFQRPDPKLTPRAGGFWTHDQRQDEEYFDHGRGRGRGFRGGFRGRGRGFPLRGGMQGGSRGQELTVEEPRGKKMSGEDGELEMDKLWAEMKAKDKARAERVEREAQEAEERAEERAQAKREEEQAVVEVEVQAPRVNGTGKRDKWGHEGFESMSAVEQFQANRGPIRARGRGRGAFGPFPPRGFPHPIRGRFNPAFRPPFAAPTAPRAQPVLEPQTLAPAAGRSPVKSSEATITQAGVEDLLAPPSQSVTVRLPGGVEQVVEPQVVSPPAQPSPASLLNGAGEFVPSRTPIPEFLPSANPSPVPIAVQQFTGSDHGSMSSGGPPTAVANPGYFAQGSVGPNGEVYNGEYQRYYPQRYRQQAPSGQFYPQSFSPDHYANGHAQQPSLGSRGSFSSQFYQDGRQSPFYAPSPMGQPNGFFVPPRSSKVSIRAPVGGEETEESRAERAAYRQRIQQQGYNPYASVNENGYGNGPNGHGGAVNEGMGGTNGHGNGHGEAVYYNQWQPQGPYVQGGYEFTEYGY